MSAETARWCGGWADGLVTINQPRETLERVIDAFREGGGEGRPIYLQVHLSWAASEEEALRIAHDQWRTNVFAPPLCWDLETVEQFDLAAAHVRPEDMRQTVLVSADPADTPTWLCELGELGFEQIHLHHVGQDLRPFIDAFGEHVLPELARVTRKATSDVWWKNAVFYCLDVETFLDTDGDGCGDLPGLCERVDYLTGLGIDCLWLMPFMPSCQRDDGYDITDFYGVDPRLGTHGDLLEVVRTARERRDAGDRGPRRQPHLGPASLVQGRAARAANRPSTTSTCGATRSPRRSRATSCSPTRSSSNWAFDDEAGRWYMHRFYSHQPDLNVANPEVRDEIAQVAGFWLEQGLSGFRVDAVPFLIEPTGMPEGRPPGSARAAARPAALHRPAQRRGGAARGGQPGAGGAARVLRRRGRR